MKIIDQSHQILEDNTDLIQQIAHRARICYQSWDKETPETNERLFHNCIKTGHMSVLEMGRITMKVDPDEFFYEDIFDEDNELNYLKFIFSNYLKFITVDPIDGYISASVRTLIEIWDGLSRRVQRELVSQFPDIFKYNGKPRPSATSIFCEYPEDGPDYMKHKYQAVQIVTNRAMTHEIVRHRPCSFLQESQRYVRYDTPDGIEFIRPIWFNPEGCDLRLNDEASDIWLNSVKFAEQRYNLLIKLKQPQQAREVLPNSTKTEIIIFANLAEWRHIFFMRTSSKADPQMQGLMRPILEDFKKLYPGRFDELKVSRAGM